MQLGVPTRRLPRRPFAGRGRHRRIRPRRRRRDRSPVRRRRCSVIKIASLRHHHHPAPGPGRRAKVRRGAAGSRPGAGRRRTAIRSRSPVARAAGVPIAARTCSGVPITRPDPGPGQSRVQQLPGEQRRVQGGQRQGDPDELAALTAVHGHRVHRLHRSQPTGGEVDEPAVPAEHGPERAVRRPDHDSGVPVEKSYRVVVLGDQDRPADVPVALGHQTGVLGEPPGDPPGPLAHPVRSRPVPAHESMRLHGE